ncbi:MAG TPA: ABC transporter permease subunit [Phycisphaerales bacterium]|nr:ABC transporter permease subunit [Phycisphaerales bacterium]
MINLGLVRRAWLETRGATLTFGVCGLLVATLLHFALPRFQKSIEVPSVAASRISSNLSSIRSAMLGTDVSDAPGREIAAAVAWSHPFFLALVFAHIVTVSTRVPAGEADKGTLDVLLGLPVSRWELFISETVVMIFTAGMVLLLALIGSRIGNHFAPEGMTPGLGAVAPALGNLFVLTLAVGAVGMLSATVTDRRMRAVAAVLIVIVASLLLNYLQLLWEPAKRLSFLGLLNYYRPIWSLRTGEWAWRDIGILCGIAGTLWVGAGVWFSRRDLSTT